jgi:hypothetical protein
MRRLLIVISMLAALFAVSGTTAQATGEHEYCSTLFSRTFVKNPPNGLSRQSGDWTVYYSRDCYQVDAFKPEVTIKLQHRPPGGVFSLKIGHTRAVNEGYVPNGSETFVDSTCNPTYDYRTFMQWTSSTGQQQNDYSDAVWQGSDFC